MKKLTLVLTTVLLAATTLQADEELRYDDPSGKMSMTVSHDIEVRRSEPVEVSRDFSFDLALATDPSAAAVTVTVDRATGTNEAHGSKQRLGTRHLTGKSALLSIADDGRQLEADQQSEAMEVNLGTIVSPGFSISGVLGDILPVLPEEGVVVGTTWTTERPVRSLEGWAWATGVLNSQHRVTAVDERDAHTVLTVVTDATASLGPVEGGRAYSGDLKRTMRWTFDATDGRLLALSMEQETEGDSEVPQGKIPLYQLTRVELAPAS